MAASNAVATLWLQFGSSRVSFTNSMSNWLPKPQSWTSQSRRHCPFMCEQLVAWQCSFSEMTLTRSQTRLPTEPHFPTQKEARNFVHKPMMRSPRQFPTMSMSCFAMHPRQAASTEACTFACCLKSFFFSDHLPGASCKVVDCD